MKARKSEFVEEKADSSWNPLSLVWSTRLYRSHSLAETKNCSTKFPSEIQRECFCLCDLCYHKVKLFSFRAASLNSGPAHPVTEENSRSTQHDAFGPALCTSPPATRPNCSSGVLEKLLPSKTALCQNILEYFSFVFIFSFPLINLK